MLVALIILLTGTYTSAFIGTGRGTKRTNMADVLVNMTILSEFSNVLSGVRCVDLCLQNEACVSVFYRRQHRRCQLHDVLFMSPQDGEQETGTVYYSVTTGDCPSGYVHNRLLNFCYQLHQEKMTYDKGLADCKSRGEHFVVIDSEDKQNHVVKQINSSLDTGPCNYYIDGSDAANEGHWVFHDGRKMTYFPWAPDYPRGDKKRDYLMAGSDYNFRWLNAIRGKYKNFYICGRDM
ncbi:C-type lectin domain family 17, member A-like [Haliotis cracherodii]|uniref:C-type lectin domain family 17, member A-like n=1 Tax=Haliotis cracherodii TaxID=6455 RepID=UPI0039EB810B